jgi:endonuclease/exonuclease/phosphatase family metal-dependent hydrolase
MMRASGFNVWMTAVAALGIGCSDASDTDGAQVQTVTVATFNAGLARGYVDHAALRFDAQVSALSGLEAVDVLCLQEVWSPDDRAALIEGLSDQFPYSHFQNTTNDILFADVAVEPPACNDAEAAPLAECANAACEGDPDITTCVLSNCGDLFEAMSPECQGCAAANIGLGEIDAILAACLTEGTVGYSYDGQNGLVMLSKAPIEASAFEQFDSFLTSRGLLSGSTLGLDVYCTHLTSRLSDPVYSGEYDGYAEENAAQIARLLALVNDSDSEMPRVVTGDFNTGPMVGDLSAELSENFNLFSADGWANQNTESDSPLCTWCASNLITNGTANEAIDHVFVKGAVPSASKRLLGGVITVTGDDGNDIMTSYSDHFGLSVEITLP